MVYFSLPLPILTQNTVLVLKYIFMYLQLPNYVFFKYQMAQPFEVKKKTFLLRIHINLLFTCLFFVTVYILELLGRCK